MLVFCLFFIVKISETWAYSFFVILLNFNLSNRPKGNLFEKSDVLFFGLDSIHHDLKSHTVFA